MSPFPIIGGRRRGADLVVGGVALTDARAFTTSWTTDFSSPINLDPAFTRSLFVLYSEPVRTF
jgi:hypothetical protein